MHNYLRIDQEVNSSLIVVCTQLTDSCSVAVPVHSIRIARQWKHVICAKCVNGWQVMAAFVSVVHI
jgi:hypothetical protein